MLLLRRDRQYTKALEEVYHYFRVVVHSIAVSTLNSHLHGANMYETTPNTDGFDLLSIST
jgi:hypothetical protein